MINILERSLSLLVDNGPGGANKSQGKPGDYSNSRCFSAVIWFRVVSLIIEEINNLRVKPTALGDRLWRLGRGDYSNYFWF